MIITKDGRVRYASMVIASVAILAVPALSNLIVNAVLRARYPAPGAFYSVNGRPMHLYCTGHGFPTVILDAGGGNDWLIWQKVQPAAAKTQRVCSYDRAGTGWSELQPGVQDATNIAIELHQLLKQADEREPFVLVAASVDSTPGSTQMPFLRRSPVWFSSVPVLLNR